MGAMTGLLVQLINFLYELYLQSHFFHHCSEIIPTILVENDHSQSILCSSILRTCLEQMQGHWNVIQLSNLHLVLLRSHKTFDDASGCNVQNWVHCAFMSSVLIAMRRIISDVALRI